MLLVAALMLLTLSEDSAAFAQRGRGRQQGASQKGSRRQGPEPVFHTDVPNRLLDMTLARPTGRSVTVVVTVLVGPASAAAGEAPATSRNARAIAALKLFDAVMACLLPPWR